MVNTVFSRSRPEISLVFRTMLVLKTHECLELGWKIGKIKEHKFSSFEEEKSNMWSQVCLEIRDADKDHANFRDDDNFDDDVSMVIPMHDFSMLMMMMMMTTMTIY